MRRRMDSRGIAAAGGHGAARELHLADADRSSPDRGDDGEPGRAWYWHPPEPCGSRRMPGVPPLVRRPGSTRSGMSVDVGREMPPLRAGADRRTERVEQVVEAPQWPADMTITNASAARATLVDFTEPPLVAIELGHLSFGVPHHPIAEVDRPGVRVASVSGSSSRQARQSRRACARVRRCRHVEGGPHRCVRHQQRRTKTVSRWASGCVLDGRWGRVARPAVPAREAGSPLGHHRPRDRRRGERRPA